ncbi:recombinase family protein [Streptomyces netropsis]|uniref:recombinase family protein n=1 Tax=Streptomyces netropsis TaxID=55404 RepID=UPI001C869E56|nr:recombinase family protein [Streptomyces netropsis]
MTQISEAGHPEHVAAVLRVAAGYTRQSKKKADKSEASPKTQDDATARKARERGCKFLGHYRDIGVSGCNPNAKRKNFERLLNDCRDEKFKRSSSSTSLDSRAGNPRTQFPSSLSCSRTMSPSRPYLKDPSRLTTRWSSSC